MRRGLFQEDKCFVRNKNFYATIIEFIDSEATFSQVVSDLMILCNYKLKVINICSQLQSKSEHYIKNTGLEGLNELIGILEALKSSTSSLENLINLSKKFTSQPQESRDNDFYKKANVILISEFKKNFNCKMFKLKFNIFLPYSLYYEKYVRLIESLFKDESPEILYLVNSKYVETITLMKYSYQLGGFQLTQNDWYMKVLNPVLSSALSSILQRGPKYTILFQNMVKYAPLEVVYEIKELISTCELSLYSINKSKGLHQSIKEPAKSVVQAGYFQWRPHAKESENKREKKLQPLSISEIKKKERYDVLVNKINPLRASSSAPPEDFGRLSKSKPRKRYRPKGLVLPSIEEEDSGFRLFARNRSKSAPPTFRNETLKQSSKP